MKKTKCKMTISEKHLWQRISENHVTSDSILGMVMETIEKYKKCEACGMIDDRKYKRPVVER